MPYVNGDSSCANGFRRIIPSEVGRYVCAAVRYGVCHGAPRPTAATVSGAGQRIARRRSPALRPRRSARWAIYGVSMETIASRVGISAAALYRHYSSKYELFRDAVLSLGQQLVDCTAFADDAATRRSRN